jgi:hypothetical protein
MLEYILFIIVLFFIGILFYKQANEEFQILQLDAERLSELPTLYVDRSPIVVSDFQTPSLGTEEELLKRAIDLRLPPHIPKETASYLAKEAGLSIWFEHHLYKQLLPSPYTQFIYSFNTSLWPLRRGLFKTTAFQTLIMPTQGTASVKLMLQKMIPYLPSKWVGRGFSELSLYDTPLLGQIQFIEIRVRKGNLLFLPAHLIVDVESFRENSSVENAWVFMAEIHHPISLIAS